MSPRFLFVLAALPLLAACPRAAPRQLASPPGQDAQALWPAVEKLASDADRDFIMDAAQAKEYGIVDQVISRRER